MRLFGGLTILVAAAATCIATLRWWLKVRRRNGYSFNDRNFALRMGALGAVGLILAIQLMLGH